MEQQNNNNKTYIWIAVGCLAIIICVVGVFLFGFGGLVWLGLRSPDNVNISIDAPVSANVGDDVEILISVTNTSSASLELSSIDFSMNFLNGFTITNVDPPYSDIGQYDALGGGETFQTYYFYRTIAPGDTLILTFGGTAVLQGDFSGTIDVCIDSDFNCGSNITRTLIR